MEFGICRSCLLYNNRISKIKRIEDGGDYAYYYWCPSCEDMHGCLEENFSLEIGQAVGCIINDMKNKILLLPNLEELINEYKETSIKPKDKYCLKCLLTNIRLVMLEGKNCPKCNGRKSIQGELVANTILNHCKQLANLLFYVMEAK